jgi:hypothetical protein
VRGQRNLLSRVPRRWHGDMHGHRNLLGWISRWWRGSLRGQWNLLGWLQQLLRNMFVQLLWWRHRKLHTLPRRLLLPLISRQDPRGDRLPCCWRRGQTPSVRAFDQASDGSQGSEARTATETIAGGSIAPASFSSNPIEPPERPFSHP